MDISSTVLQPLNLLASAEVHIGPYLQLQREHTPSKPPGASNPAEAESNEIEVHFPPHWQQYTCHMEHASWLNNVVQAGLSERLKVNQTGAQEGQVSQVLENELMKGISQRLLVVAGGLMKSGLRGMLNSASQERDMPAMEDGESLTTSSKMAGAEIKEDGSQQADGEAALDSGGKNAHETTTTRNSIAHCGKGFLFGSMKLPQVSLHAESYVRLSIVVLLHFRSSQLS